MTRTTPHASHEFEHTLMALTAAATDLSISGSMIPLDVMHPSPITEEPPQLPSQNPHNSGPTPSSSTHDTSPMSRIASTSLHRSSSRIQQWIESQHHIALADSEADPLYDASTSALGTGCHPYLAYPHLSAASLLRKTHEDIITLDSYVLVEEDMPIPGERVPSGNDANVTQTLAASKSPASKSPATTLSLPSTTRKSFRHTQNIFQSPSPLRNFHLTFTSRRASASNSGVPRSPSPTRGPSRLQLIHRKPLPNTGTRPGSPDVITSPSKSPTAWKFRRPSVVGHFPPPSDAGSETSQPRVSTSSSVTRSSTTVYTRTSTDASSVSRMMPFGSTRAHSSTSNFNSTPSLWSLPTDASHMDDPPESEKVLAQDKENPKTRKKRKLIVSGLPANDERRLEAVRKWCESFGELNQIVRVPNGDLHVDFRKAERESTSLESAASASHGLPESGPEFMISPSTVSMSRSYCARLMDRSSRIAYMPYDTTHLYPSDHTTPHAPVYPALTFFKRILVMPAGTL
ncbi:hypothetical protein A0H81_01413 [Grifola frondosa]|uniref:Uncharacterized protein n=1 Tax=Grifola frondosa TaxID=5627 RepID=A0A1C7MTA5_GRIFR|nr:hypothetical protein A0H81_01413 [Grifola frondosa]